MMKNGFCATDRKLDYLDFYLSRNLMRSSYDWSWINCTVRRIKFILNKLKIEIA